MHITTVKQMADHLILAMREGFKIHPLFIASKKFKMIDEITFTSDPVIGHSFYDLADERVNENSYFLYWINEYNSMSSRSLNDMNIPVNHYNDWNCFTTREEAEEYVNPKPNHAVIARNKLIGCVFNIHQFEDNIRPICKENKINGIKLVRSICDMSLTEAKIYVEAIIIHHQYEEFSLGDILNNALKQ